MLYFIFIGGLSGFILGFWEGYKNSKDGVKDSERSDVLEGCIDGIYLLFSGMLFGLMVGIGYYIFFA